MEKAELCKGTLHVNGRKKKRMGNQRILKGVAAIDRPQKRKKGKK